MGFTGVPELGTAALTFLTKVADLLTDPTKYASWSRERQLEFLREGHDAAIDARDWPAADRWLAMYRVLDEQTP
jgi:hypothetical protein